jgi:hypothetical protein
MRGRIDEYMERVDALGGEGVTNGGKRAREFTPEQVVTHIDELVSALDTLGAGNEL